MSEQHNRVLSFIQQNGPSVPNEIRQKLQLKDNFLTGAILSELLGNGELAITQMNHGTSKLYYDANHPESLELISKYLGEKDRRAFELLKAEQVVRASDLSPLMRVAAASIKDFSRNLILETPDGEQEFYFYYLLSQEEAIALIKKKLFGITEQKEQPKQVKEEPKLEPKTEKPKRTRKPKAVQQTLAPQAEVKPLLAEGFAKQVHSYFEQKQIGLLQVIDSKKTELSCIVSLPSAVGAMQYFCKAKAKKTATDGDLASALLEAQQHKLPLLYITAGTVTKKAQDLLKNQLKGVVVVQPWA